MEHKTHSGGTHALDDRHHPAHPLAPRCLRGQHRWNSPPAPGDRAYRDRLPSRDGSETSGLTPANAQGRPNRPPFFFELPNDANCTNDTNTAVPFTNAVAVFVSFGSSAVRGRPGSTLATGQRPGSPKRLLRFSWVA